MTQFQFYYLAFIGTAILTIVTDNIGLTLAMHAIVIFAAIISSDISQS